MAGLRQLRCSLGLVWLWISVRWPWVARSDYDEQFRQTSEWIARAGELAALVYQLRQDQDAALAANRRLRESNRSLAAENQRLRVEADHNGRRLLRLGAVIDAARAGVLN